MPCVSRAARAPLAGLMSLCVLAIAPGVVRASPASAPRPVVASKKPSTAVVARRLAVGLSRARTQGARRRRLLDVMRTLHLGVYTGRGRPVVRGGRPHRVYLYDFEIGAIAAELGKRRTESVDDMARRLAVAGVTSGGQPLSGAKLARALTRGVRRARAHPRARDSLVPLLARELGRRHRASYDLARARADKIRLDPLQSVLIGADLAAAASGRGARARGAGDTAAGACDDQLSDVVKDQSPFGKWIVSLINSKPLRAVAVTEDAIHGSILAAAVVVVERSATFQKSHFGPAGHAPVAGGPIDFGLQALMLADLPDEVIKCGPLIGVKFPKKGPIPGVGVLWTDEYVNVGGGLQSGAPLERLGTVTAAAKTDDRGEGWLHFTPRDEQLPGFGAEKTATNVKRATVLYQSAFGNIPGSWMQLVARKSVLFRWRVTFHKPKGFLIRGMVRDNYFVQFGHPSGRVDVGLHKCGSDPFGAYTGSWSHVSEGDTLESDGTWAFVPGAFTNGEEIYNGMSIPTTYLRAQISLTPPPQVIFYEAAGAGSDGPFTLPLQEDTGCPDNGDSPP